MTRGDFAAASRGFAGKFRVESTQEIKDLHTSGDLAYAWSHITVVMTAEETGARAERAGHVLTVFRKSPEGEWLLARDANLIKAG
jgi:ketosteroid isomerase-like protein